MRVGVVVDLDRTPLGDVASVAAEVADAGLDLLWLRAAPRRPFDPLVAAASCAGVTDTLVVGAQVPVGQGHPLYLAEERNVVDLLLGGRFVLGMTVAENAGASVLAEWVEILLAAAGTAPFVHHGPQHTIPARLPQNTTNVEERVRVTPAPAALEPTLWVAGEGARQVAETYAVSLVNEASDDASRAWSVIAERLGPATRRLRRPGLRDWDTSAEGAVELARRLCSERDAWGLDTVLVRTLTAPGDRGWEYVLGALARTVRPRLQLDRLPSGLVDLWDSDGVHTDHLGDEHMTDAATDRKART